MGDTIVEPHAQEPKPDEFKVLRTVCDAVEPLDDEARKRVLRYAEERNEKPDETIGFKGKGDGN